MTSPRPLTPSDLWRMRRVGAPEPAPDGSFVIIPVTAYDVDENRGVTQLFRLNAGSGEPEALTTDERNSTNPVVSGDGTRVAFLGKPVDDAEARPQLFVLSLGGGEARRLTDFPLGVLDARWLPDGSGLILLSEVYRDALGLEEAGERKADLDETKVKAKVTEDRIYRFWTRWLTDGAVPHLFHLDLESGDLTDLIPDATRWMYFMEATGSFDVSPDGTEVAFAAEISEPPHDRLQTAVFTVPIGGGPERRLSEDLPAHQRRPRYSPDGRFIVFGIQREWDFYADRVRLVAYERATGTETVLTGDWDRSAQGWEFTADGRRIVLAAEDNARTNLYTMPVAAGEPELLARGGFAGAIRPTSNSSVHFLNQSLTAPPEVHRVGLNGGEVEAVSSFNRHILDEVELGEVREMEFPGANGDPVQGFLVLPPGFDETRQWPLVHAIHGGPHGLFGDAWHWRWSAQAFAAPGYVVAMVNFHGSTSWGQDFAARIHGSWGDEPAADILAATDDLIEQGFIDPNRMAIAGGSYGGYLTSWLTGETDRFAAAIVHAGVTNLLGQYASDVTAGRERAMGGNAWDSIDAVLRWSPTHHAAGFVTPTLVIHGEQDYRVVVTQGLELYGILKAKGVEARLVYYPDEGHWILKPQNSLHWYGEVLRWLERYIG